MSGKSESRCRICGKLLTDPMSVERGIGPECYGSRKRAEHADKTGNLFAARANYTWGVDGYVLWIVDQGGAKSVTNDIEFVLGDIYQALGQDLFRKLVIYRDSMQQWDGIRLRNCDCYTGIATNGQRSPRVDIDDFYSINEKDYIPARRVLINLVNSGKLKPLMPMEEVSNV